jgi:aminoglycoside phosphotransferase (APT) family kinase protein
MSDSCDPSSEAFADKLRADGVFMHPNATMTPLSGGVSSDIYLVQDGDDRYVVKRALPRLKVKQEWFADVRRNAAELAYLRYVGRIAPENVPAVRCSGEGYFAMAYLGQVWSTWKQRLMDGRFDLDVAARSGKLLGTIHGASAGHREIAGEFNPDSGFRQLRVEPYLTATAAHHPTHADALLREAERLLDTHEVLVHGDYSPKNMLVSGDRLIILDCEVAWYGDAAFDLAFLVNHLLLKTLYHAPRRVPLVQMVGAVTRAYLHGRALEGDAWDGLDRRAGRLLMMLLLARVDGKSPAEYLDEPGRQCVRCFIDRYGFEQNWTIREVAEQWFAFLQKDIPTHADRGD